jgi:hypothetical protein
MKNKLRHLLHTKKKMKARTMKMEVFNSLFYFLTRRAVRKEQKEEEKEKGRC